MGSLAIIVRIMVGIEQQLLFIPLGVICVLVVYLKTRNIGVPVC